MGHWVEVLVCTTVPRTLPTQSKAGIRLLGANCQVWVGSESTKAYSCGPCRLEELYVFPQANNPAVSTRHVTLQSSSLPTTQELPLAHLPKGHTFSKIDMCFPNTSQQTSSMKVG